MEQTRQAVFKVFHGPNINTSFAAVSISFAAPFKHPLPSIVVRQAATALLTDVFAATLILREAVSDFATVVAETATALQDVTGRTDLRQQIDRLDNGHVRVSIGFHDVDMAATALQCGYDLAAAIFTRHAGGTVNTQRLRAIYKRAINLAARHQPDKNSLRLIRVAKSKDIPAISFTPGSSVWMYGYGARAVRFWKAVAQDESFVGTSIAKDKVWSQRLLQRAGFPGVRFGTADNIQSAREVARQIGYPLVTKPTDSSGGHGVTVGIESDKDFETGFAEALSRSRARTVQIEEFIAGDHCRLTVFGGKLRRAALYKPAQVVGDGNNTISALIEAENALRATLNSPAQVVKQVEVDTQLTTLLARQGFKLDDRPPDGAKILLRQASNTNMGGRVYEVNDIIHPDNVELAEAVPRILGVRGMGMDFITPDITKPWHKAKCAIVDINCPYGMGADSLAEMALAEVFAPGDNGRIPCIMIIDENALALEAVVKSLQSQGIKVGRVDSAASISGPQRFGSQPDWPGRILALMLDPACEVLATLCTSRDIEEFGLPYVRFDIAFIPSAATLPTAVLRLLHEHVAKVINLDPDADLEEIAVPAVSDLLNTRQPTTLGLAR